MFSTLAMIRAVPKRATWSDKTLMSGSILTIFSATSFWTRRVRVFGGLGRWRKWLMSGEVM